MSLFHRPDPVEPVDVSMFSEENMTLMRKLREIEEKKDKREAIFKIRQQYKMAALSGNSVTIWNNDADYIAACAYIADGMIAEDEEWREKNGI